MSSATPRDDRAVTEDDEPVRERGPGKDVAGADGPGEDVAGWDAPGEYGPTDDPAGGNPPDERPFSGLKNPAAAVRGVGMATLGLEWLVVVLSIQPIRTVAPETPGWAIGVVAALAFACLGVAALLRYPWGWHVGTGLQVSIIIAGLLLQWALLLLGVIFLAIWIGLLRLRRTLSQPARFDH